MPGGNLTNFRQDIDSTVGGSGYWEVAYAYAKATGGRNTLRRTQTTLPGGEVFKFHYRTGTASHDDKYSRVTTVRDAEDTDLAGYQYNGAGQVVRTELSEVGIFSKAYNGSGTTFGRLDRFNRTLISSWTRDLSTNRDIYKVTLGYDRNSNITSQDDAVHTGHDVAYANDDLNRLVDADEGTLASGSIGTRTRRQQWTLNQTGNWNRDKVDLNGDADYLDAGELDDTRTHNAVNELLTRDTNTSSPAEFSLTYDAVGNMTDDGVYKYEWDAFYRLRKVKNQSNALVSEYWYNGLGYLVTRHQDTDADGDVDGSDLRFHTAYDERWRPVATYRGSDANPKERFLHHWAGTGGRGGSSYIDSVVLRDRDMTNGWTGAADGTLKERVYYLQNWRADVVGLVEPDGSGGATMAEWIKYSAYGVPFALSAGDTDSDGDCDSTDDAQVTTWKNAPLYDVRGDLDLDGDVDAADESLVVSAHQSLGRGVLSSTSIGNRKGYAGYEGDAMLGAKWHVRHRVLDSVVGRWAQRDPTEYSDSFALFLYVRGQPLRARDPEGLQSLDVGGLPGEFTKCMASFSVDPVNEDGGWLLEGTGNCTRNGNCLTGETCRCVGNVGVHYRHRIFGPLELEPTAEDFAQQNELILNQINQQAGGHSAPQLSLSPTNQLWQGWHNIGGPDMKWSSNGAMINNTCVKDSAQSFGQFCTISKDGRLQKLGNRVASQLRAEFVGSCGAPPQTDRITVTSGGMVREIDGAGKPVGQFAFRTLHADVTFSCDPCRAGVRPGTDDQDTGSGRGGD